MAPRRKSSNWTSSATGITPLQEADNASWRGHFLAQMAPSPLAPGPNTVSRARVCLVLSTWMASLWLLGCNDTERLGLPTADCVAVQSGTFENCLELHAPILSTGTWIIRTHEEYHEVVHHNVCGANDPSAVLPPEPGPGEALVLAAFARGGCSVCLDFGCALASDQGLHVELAGGSAGDCPDYIKPGIWALVPDDGRPISVGDPRALPHLDGESPCD